MIPAAPHGRDAIGPGRDGPTIVFLHANGFHGPAYRSVLGPLAERRPVITPDLRGFGANPAPADPQALTSWNVFAADVAAWFTARDGAPVVLAGHSLGATTALLTAAMVPNAVSALALFDPVIVPPIARRLLQAPGQVTMMNRYFPLARSAARRNPSFTSRDAAFQAYRGRGAFKTWSDEALRDYVEHGFVDTPDGVRLACDPAWEARAFAAQRHNPYRAIAQVRAPVTLIAGGRGSTCPSISVAALRRAAPSMVFERWSDTTHFAPFEAPERIRDVVDRVAGSVR